MRKSSLLTTEQMEDLTTNRLLAYKNRLYKVHEHEHWSCPDGNQWHVTKESPEWKAAVASAKAIRAKRENVAK